MCLVHRRSLPEGSGMRESGRVRGALLPHRGRIHAPPATTAIVPIPIAICTCASICPAISCHRAVGTPSYALIRSKQHPIPIPISIPSPVSSGTGVGTSTTCTLAAAARARGALASTRLALDPWQV